MRTHRDKNVISPTTRTRRTTCARTRNHERIAVHSTLARPAPEMPAGYLPIEDPNIPELGDRSTPAHPEGVGLTRARQTDVASTSNKPGNVPHHCTDQHREKCLQDVDASLDRSRVGPALTERGPLPSSPFTSHTGRLVK